MSTFPSYRQVEEALARLGVSRTPAEVHGMICGALCTAKKSAVRPLALLGGAVTKTPADGAVLDALCEASAKYLCDPHLGWTPLLPGDEAPLKLRAAALADWCEGFLFGVVEGGGVDLRRCSEEVREVITDFTEFTRAALREGDDAEVEEGAYVELVEYIRVGVQLVFMELHGRPPERGARTLH